MESYFNIHLYFIKYSYNVLWHEHILCNNQTESDDFSNYSSSTRTLILNTVLHNHLCLCTLWLLDMRLMRTKNAALHPSDRAPFVIVFGCNHGPLHVTGLLCVQKYIYFIIISNIVGIWLHSHSIWSHFFFSQVEEVTTIQMAIVWCKMNGQKGLFQCACWGMNED